MEVTDTTEFAHSVLAAEEEQNAEKVVGLLCGSVKVILGVYIRLLLIFL